MSSNFRAPGFDKTYPILGVSNGDNEIEFIKAVEKKLETAFNHAAVDIAECIVAAKIDPDKEEDIRVTIPHFLDPSVGFDDSLTERMLYAINQVLKDEVVVCRAIAITVVRDCDFLDGAWTCHRILLVGLRHVEIIDLK